MRNSKLFKEYGTKDVQAYEHSKKAQQENINFDINKALEDKLDREFKEFCKELMKKDKSVILERAYEITVKEELKEELKNMSLHMAEKEMLFLQDDILNECYQEWLKCDASLGESLRECLGDTVSTLTKHIGTKYNLLREKEI